MINLFVDSQTVKFFWSIKIGVKNIQLVRNCILCTFCKKQQKAIKIQLLTLLYWSERRVKLGLLILLYWFEKRAGVELPVHLLDFLSCWYYRQQHKTSTYLKKKKEERDKILENICQILSTNTYVFIFFPYVGLIYSFVQYIFSLTIVTSWLLTVAILFDQR